MKDSEIWVALAIEDDALTMKITREDAAYIAHVMGEEYMRTGVVRALGIAGSIRVGLPT